MPQSYSHGKKEIAEIILNKVKESNNFTILDIGCGIGTYSNVLRRNNKLTNYQYKIDAVEVVGEYIEKFNLLKKYNNVYIFDVRDDSLFSVIDNYDLVIMGDVLEHLSVEDAQFTLRRLKKHCKEIIVAVPYLMKQSAKAGKYEEHLQPDLTHEVFLQRYPGSTLLVAAQVNEKRIYAYWLIKGELN